MLDANWIEISNTDCSCMDIDKCHGQIDNHNK